MRCETVMRELSAPGGAVGPEAVSAHLASCPRCASWAEGVDRLDRIWALTRPAEPSPEAFDALWARAVARADEPEILPIAASPRWRRWGVAALAGAQAAAILLGAVASLSRPVPVVASVYDFRAEEGRPLIVSLDGPRGAAPTVRSPESDASSYGTDTVAADLDVLNYMESL